MNHTRFWHKWFNVTTIDVTKRITSSLLFFTPTLVNVIGKNPDLYGPFWIYTTLIFMLAGSGNLASYFKHSSKDADMFLFDFNLIGRAAFFVYFCGFLTPLAISILLRALERAVDPVKITCIYGYAYFIYIISTAIAVYPNDYVQWSALLYGGITSIIHLLINFHV